MAPGDTSGQAGVRLRLSPKQIQVLRWLVAYPQVQLSYLPAGPWVCWTASWCKEYAPREVRGKRPEGGTPRVSITTFGVLQRHGLLRLALWAHRTGYYTVSPRGVVALAALEVPACPD